MDNPKTIATLRTKDKGQKKETHTQTRRKAKYLQHGPLTRRKANVAIVSGLSRFFK